MIPSPVTVINVDAVAFQEPGGVWIGQCIQFDIAAHANSLPSLVEAIRRQIAANVCVNEKLGRELLDGIPRAPKKYEEAFHSNGLSLAASEKIKSLSSFTRIHLSDIRVVESV